MRFYAPCYYGVICVGEKCQVEGDGVVVIPIAGAGEEEVLDVTQPLLAPLHVVGHVQEGHVVVLVARRVKTQFMQRRFISKK